MFKVRIVYKEWTNNYGTDDEDYNLYDWAPEFASFLVVHEIPFRYSYPDAQCTFEIEMDRAEFEKLWAEETVWSNTETCVSGFAEPTQIEYL